jgi:hypothetical protein
MTYGHMWHAGFREFWSRGLPFRASVVTQYPRPTTPSLWAKYLSLQSDPRQGSRFFKLAPGS